MMLMRLKALAAAIICCVLPFAAQAGWQNTLWGMSPDEIRALYPDVAPYAGTAHAGTGNLQKDHLVLGQTYRLVFVFADTGLSQVALFKPTFCGEASPALHNAYGISHRVEAYTVGWRDASNGNLVRMTARDGFSCHIDYLPLPVPNAPGGF